MNFKIALLFVIALGILAPALAIDVKMDVFPYSDSVNPGDNFLVFGYIYSDDEIGDSDIKLKIYNGTGDLVKTEIPEVELINADNSNNAYFYQMMGLSEIGQYDIKLKIDGNTEETANLDIGLTSSDVITITNTGYSINGDEITFDIGIKNTDTHDHDVTIYLKGENNFGSPTKLQIDVNAGDVEDVEKTYSLSDFGDGNFVVGIQAKTDDDDYSDPSYLIVYIENGNSDNSDENQTDTSDYYGSLSITDVELSNDILYPGDVTDAYVTVKNSNNKETQFKLEYRVNNQLFRSGDVAYVQPNSKITVSVPVEVPDAEQIDFYVKVSNPSYSDTDSKVFLVLSTVKYFVISTENDSLYVELENKTSTYFDVRNRGNEEDTYKIDILGWDNYATNDTVIIGANKTKRINLTLDIASETPAKTYPIIIDVCNSEDSCKSKTVNLVISKSANQETSVNWSKSFEHVKFNSADKPITYVFNITNEVNQEKDYRIVIHANENLTTDILENTFSLGLNEYKTIEFNLTPKNKENNTAELTIYAEDSKVLEKELLIEYDEHYSGITGMFIGDIGGVYVPGLIALALIGTAFAVLTIYRELNKKVWTEKVISYQKKPNTYWTYMKSNPRHTMNQPQGPMDQL